MRDKADNIAKPSSPWRRWLGFAGARRQPATRSLQSRFNIYVLGLMGVGLALGLVLSGVWIWLQNTALLSVNSLQLSGQFLRVSADAIQSAAKPYLQSRNLLSVDIHGVQSAIEKVSWVHHASVRRLWPDKLAIVVYEQTAVATWATGGLVNNEGRLFFPDPHSYPPGLPEFSGPEDTEATVSAVYRDMSKILAPSAAAIVKLVMDERRSWRLQLDNGLQIELGRNHVYEHLLRFVRYYGMTVAGRLQEVERVDLRYTNGFAVRWKKQPA